MLVIRAWMTIPTRARCYTKCRFVSATKVTSALHRAVLLISWRRSCAKLRAMLLMRFLQAGQVAVLVSRLICQPAFFAWAQQPEKV